MKCLRVELSRNVNSLLAFSSIIAFCFSNRRILKAIQKHVKPLTEPTDFTNACFSDVKYDRNVQNGIFDLNHTV